MMKSRLSRTLVTGALKSSLLTQCVALVALILSLSPARSENTFPAYQVLENPFTRTLPDDLFDTPWKPHFESTKLAFSQTMRGMGQEISDIAS